MKQINGNIENAIGKSQNRNNAKAKHVIKCDFMPPPELDLSTRIRTITCDGWKHPKPFNIASNTSFTTDSTQEVTRNRSKLIADHFDEMDQLDIERQKSRSSVRHKIST